jgi:hypothetical protein
VSRVVARRCGTRIDGTHRFHSVTLLNGVHPQVLQHSLFLFFFVKETTPQGNVGPGIRLVVCLQE